MRSAQGERRKKIETWTMSPEKFSRRTALSLPLIAGLMLAGCAAEPVAAKQVTPPRPDPKPAEPDPVELPEPVSLLLVSLARGDQVAIVDPARDDPEQAVRVITAGAAPWGVGVHEGTGYAATAEGLAVVDLARGERTGLVPYLHPTSERSTGEYRPGGLGLAVSPDGSRVYVAVTAGDGSFFLEVYDTDRAEFVGSAPVGLRPFDVLVDPDGAWAATIDHDSFTVSVVDADTLAVTQHEIAPFGTEGGLASWEKPHYGAVDTAVGANYGSILLPYQGEVVVRLDPVKGATSEIASAANSHAHGATLAGTELLTVGTGSFGSATGVPNLSILDLNSGEERVVPLRVPHETVAVWRDAAGRDFAAVAGGNTRDAGWNGLTLVALDDLSVREIALPGYPQAVVAFARS